MSDSREVVSVAPATVVHMSDETLHLRRLDSPIGRIEVLSDGRAVTSLAIERDGALPHDETPECGDEVLDRAVAQLEEYFAGSRHDFDVPVDLRGTDFQRSVWEQLVQLQWGEVVSYGDLGQATGRPTAGRAVGGAVGANPIPIIVPCHRVLGVDGRITGYSGGEGIPTKAWLLDHEGIAHTVPASAAAVTDATAAELDLFADESSPAA
jgi:methylated-DNA-[protein]-cysteine S-methyltransferase